MINKRMHNIPKLIREFALMRSDICERCSSDKNIHLHHRDGNTFNNEEDNVEVLCRNCHVDIHRKLGDFGRRRKIGLTFKRKIGQKPYKFPYE